MDFWGFIGVILITLVLLMFFSFLLRKNKETYNDWAREERRKQLLEIVRAVRQEKGDYASRASVPRVKRAAPRARPAARRSK